MKTSAMAERIFELIDDLDSDDLMNLYNYLFPNEQITEGEIEIDE